MAKWILASLTQARDAGKKRGLANSGPSPGRSLWGQEGFQTVLSLGNEARVVWAAGKPQRKDRFPTQKRRGHQRKNTEQTPTELKEPESPEWKLRFQPQIKPAQAATQSSFPTSSSDGNRFQFHPEVS